VYHVHSAYILLDIKSPEVKVNQDSTTSPNHTKIENLFDFSLNNFLLCCPFLDKFWSIAALSTHQDQKMSTLRKGSIKDIKTKANTTYTLYTMDRQILPCQILMYSRYFITHHKLVGGPWIIRHFTSFSLGSSRNYFSLWPWTLYLVH